MTGGGQDGSVTARRFRQVDVFTDRPYAGNPLAVVLDAEGLDDEHAAVRALDEPLRDDVRVAAAGPGRRLPAEDLHAGAASCRSPATRPSGPVTPGSRPAGSPKAGEIVVQECGAGLIPDPPHRRRARIRGAAAGSLRAARRRDARPRRCGAAHRPRRDRRRTTGSTTAPAGSAPLLQSAEARAGAAAGRRRPFGHRRRRAATRPARRRPSRYARSSPSTARAGRIR